jgi:hypothetical protein
VTERFPCAVTEATLKAQAQVLGYIYIPFNH